MPALTTYLFRAQKREKKILTVSAYDRIVSNGESHIVSALFSYYIIPHVSGFVKCFLKKSQFFEFALFFHHISHKNSQKSTFSYCNSIRFYVII